MLSDASRILLDPDFDWFDSTLLSILRDALMDENRQHEVSLLDGSYRDTLLAHEGCLVEPHELNTHQLILAVADEMSRVGGMVSDQGLFVLETPTVPGTVRVESAAVEHDYPAAAIIAACRDMVDRGTDSIIEWRNRIEEFVDVACIGSNYPASARYIHLVWGHLRLWTFQGKVTFPDDPDVLYSCFSVPFVDRLGGSCGRKFYYSRRDAFEDEYPRLRFNTAGTMWDSLDDVRHAAFLESSRSH